MLVGQIANLASRAVARVRRKQPIPVRIARAPGPRPAWPALVPDVEITPGPSTVSLSCNVADATPDNLLVCWDDECNSMCIRVARAASAHITHDWYVEVPLPLTVRGAESKCTLEGNTLRICAPLHDTEGGTGLFISTLFEPSYGPYALSP